MLKLRFENEYLIIKIEIKSKNYIFANNRKKKKVNV